MDDKFPPPPPRCIQLTEPFQDQQSMAIQVFEATEFNFEDRSVLQGHMEAIMASKVTIIAIRGNMHMDIELQTCPATNSENFMWVESPQWGIKIVTNG